MDKRRSVLAVDDEPDVLEQIEELLQDKYQVSTARSFDDALKAFQSKKPDLAVLDIMGVNGEELLKRFRSGAPCIMLTAHALAPEHLKSTAKAGARLYLPKDELARLPEYVEKVLANPDQALWRWLVGRLDFRRWFGAAWGKADEEFLFNITLEDIEHDLFRHGYDSHGE